MDVPQPDWWMVDHIVHGDDDAGTAEPVKLCPGEPVKPPAQGRTPASGILWLPVGVLVLVVFLFAAALGAFDGH